MEYTYYLRLRPIGPECQPKGFIKATPFDNRKWVEEARVNAWGAVTYDHELTKEEVYQYDLAPLFNPRKNWSHVSEDEEAEIRGMNKSELVKFWHEIACEHTTWADEMRNLMRDCMKNLRK